MKQEIIEFFKEINKGKTRGSQAKMARDLHTSTATTNRYYSGEQVPSLQTIKDMAQKYHKKEEELKRIFGINTPSFMQQNSKNKDCHIQQVINAVEAEVIKTQMKVIETKLDLIIQMLKGGK